MRGGVYVDGFNLYHAIDDLDQPYLKWLNLRLLAERFARGHARQLDHIVFGTAYFPSDFDKKKRHERYNEALASQNIRVLLGHTTKEPASCKACNARWDQPREKETDINVALSAFHHAITGKIDVVFLLTADTDQAATLRFLRDTCPNVKRVVVTPPGRRKSTHLKDLADANIGLSLDDIDASVFPAMFNDAKGKLIVRPESYAPPKGWVHPNDRPR